MKGFRTLWVSIIEPEDHKLSKSQGNSVTFQSQENLRNLYISWKKEVYLL